MVALTGEHIHHRPGGAVFDEHCTCTDASAWPPSFGAASAEPAAAAGVSVVEPPPAPPAWASPNDVAPAPAAAVMVAVFAAAAAARRRGRRVVAAAWRFLRHRLRATAQFRKAAWGWVRRFVPRCWRWARRAGWALAVRLDAIALVSGVGVATWGAWEVNGTAGKMVLSAGLLFLGGAIGRVVTEVRSGSPR